MRYPEGGGLTAERRAFREGIRLQAGERFASGDKTAVIAKELRVSVRSVERWRRAWREGGMEVLRSAGPANSPTVTDAQFVVLEEELGRGPAAHGFADERGSVNRTV
ncbi:MULTISPECIES: helix-turn-helix domain-containing protein [unclassified Streptomyces]|uniref:helix-turn-helix domain-containing protein n=1 Tax=unclassified Streptomyces TaxID=2593676 RepID=UPI003829BC5C